MASPTLSDEQVLLRDTLADVARDLRATPEAIAEQRARPGSWETMQELGLLTMRWPQAAGGTGACAVDVALVAEALGRTPAVAPFAGPVIAAELAASTGAVPEALAALAADGALTIGLDERTLAAPASDGVAWDAAGAAHCVGLRAGRVTIAPIGDRDELPSADVTRVVRAAAPAGGSPIGESAPSVDALAGWEAFALCVVCADLVGTMTGALDLAVEHAKQRRQFGTAIGAFQALAHALADGFVSVQAARSATYALAECLDDAPPAEALSTARVAKAYAARVALSVTELAVQVHGGIGTTWESPCHLFVRRALTGAAVLGDESHQLAAIADARLGAAR